MAFGPEQVANEIGALAKRIYDTGVIDTEQRLTITYDELPAKNWNIKGDGWYGDAHLQRSSSFKFANPTENLPQETTEVSKQFLIQNKEMFGDLAFTKDFLIKLVGGVTSFEDYTYKIEDIIRSQKKNLNQACYIGPTMARTTLTSSPSTSATFTVASTQYLFIGMMIDIYNSSTLAVNNVQITGISGLTITVGTAVSAASGYTIYLHDEKLNAGSGKGLNGLPIQSDDGTDYSATFENISRTDYPGWRGNRIDASSAPLTNDLLQNAQNVLRNNSGHDYMTEDYVNFVHLDSVRRYLKIILPQKRYIDASKYDSGMSKPNMLEWNGKPIVIDPDCVPTSWFMWNKTHSGKMEIAPLAVDSTLGGNTMKWKNGYMQGVVVTYYSGQTGTNKPNSLVQIKNLAALS
jgi:hypothetical protein